MESSTLSQNLNTLIADFDAIGTNEEGPFPNASIVIFHLDTTDWNVKNADICQIAAWCKGKEPYQEYLLIPYISPVCTNENGFRVDKNGKLLHYNKVVNAVLPKDGLEKFLNFLSGLAVNTRNIILAANNCNSFHRHVLVRNLKRYNLFDKFRSLVLGFIDTIPVFKSKLTDRKDKFGLEELAKDHLDESTISQQKHAVVNVEMLVSLIEVIECSDAMMKQHVKELDGFIRFLDMKDDFENEVKDDLLRKIAEAGITTNMLKDAYRADPNDGISNLLQQGGDGKAGVKLQKPSVKKITDEVAKLCAKNEDVGNSTA